MRLGWSPYHKPPPGSVIDYQDPIANGLRACWLMNEGIGVAGVHDLTRGRNYGSFVNDTKWVPGRRGWATYYDGSGDYINVADDPQLHPGDGSWTIAFWAQPPDVNQQPMIVTKRKNAADYEQYTLGIGGTDSFEWVAGKRLNMLYIEHSGTTYRGGYSTTDVVDGDWHHFVGIADKGANTLRMYLDGAALGVTVDKATGAWPNITNTDPLRLGGNPDFPRMLTGSMESVMLWNRVLRAAEIERLYRQPYCFIRTPEPRRWWLLTSLGATRDLTAGDSLSERLQ